MEQVVQLHDLLHLVGRPGLLAVAEGGVGNQHLRRGIQGLDLVVEIDSAYLAVGENFPEKLRLFLFNDSGVFNLPGVIQ
jgi:hypothetical protein